MRISSFARSYLRKRAELLMTDACVVRDPTATRISYNPATRQATTSTGVERYSGACRLYQVPAGAHLEIGDDEYVVSTVVLALPWDAPVPEPHDIVEMTGSDDPDVIGRHLGILGIERGGGLRGSRRMAVRFIESDKEEW